MAPHPDQFWEVDAEFGSSDGELWGDFCYGQGALGAQINDAPHLPLSTRHFFDDDPGSAEVLQAGFRDAYPLAPAPLRVRVQRQPRQPWDTAWRAHFTPLDVGRTLRVLPPWEAAPSDATVATVAAGAAQAGTASRLHVIIEPGQGFGTGWHPSTHLALEALEAAVLSTDTPPVSVLDVGTGSGILSIAARRLGAGTARQVAIDIDERVVPEVRSNFQLNGLPLPEVRHCGPEALEGPGSLEGPVVGHPFALVLANIVAPVLTEHAERLAALTAQDGCLMLSGILEAERAALLETYAALGLHPHAEHGEQRRQGWYACCLVRQG